jgi:Pao retrotransposon peptidase
LVVVLREIGCNLTKIKLSFPCAFAAEDSYGKDPMSEHQVDSSKTLGFLWDMVDDNWCFQLGWPGFEKLTRRKVLTTIMSIIDPLGLLSPILVTGKSLIRKIAKAHPG